MAAAGLSFPLHLPRHCKVGNLSRRSPAQKTGDKNLGQPPIFFRTLGTLVHFRHFAALSSQARPLFARYL